MRLTLIFILLFSLQSCIISFPTKKEVQEDYYASGMLQTKSVTTIYGGKKGGQFKKTKVVLEKFYENGVLELEQKITERPASSKRNENTGEPMNRIPKKVRKFKKYDRGGKLIERGWEKTRRSKIVQYDIEIYKKIIIKENQKWRFPKIKKRIREKPIKRIKSK